MDRIDAVRREHPQQRRRPDAVSRQLRVEVAQPLVRRSHRLEDAIEQFILYHAAALEKRRLDAYPLLVDMPAERHGARTDTADVSVMRAVRDIPRDRTGVNHG